MLRLFCTNHALLKKVRPKTHAIFVAYWQPVSNNHWLKELGEGVPERIVKSQMNKMVP